MNSEIVTSKNAIFISVEGKVSVDVKEDIGGTQVIIKEENYIPKRGDFVYISNLPGLIDDSYLSIYDCEEDGFYRSIFEVDIKDEEVCFDVILSSKRSIRLATPQECETINRCLLKSGYSWNKEKLTLEMIPKFKKGDFVFLASCTRSENYICKCQGVKEDRIESFYWLSLRSGTLRTNVDSFFKDLYISRLATADEIYQLEDKVKSEKLEWNSDTEQLECIYEPKQGDIVYFGEKGMYSGCRVGIFDKKDTQFGDQYYRTLFTVFLSSTTPPDHNISNSIERPIRLATSGECKILFDKLKEINKKWNPDTKKIEDIYVPKHGDFVYFKTKGDQFEDISIFNKKCDNDYYTYFSFYKNSDNDFFNHIDDSRSHISESQILELRKATLEETVLLLNKLKEEKLSWNTETQILSKIVEFEPQTGDIICLEDKNYSEKVYMCKLDTLDVYTILVDYSFSIKTKNLYKYKDGWVRSNFILRKPTNEEMRSFLDKLEEEFLELDSENNLVEIPKEGDLCIFWDDNKEVACIAILKSMCGKFYYRESWGYKHCIKFKSKEQFKKLINDISES